jgi:hypothetical protein
VDPRLEISMLTLRVDCSLVPGVIAPITVDALLSAIEPVLGQSRRMVTALRINGVDEPAFRDAPVLARALTDDDQVDVETSAVATLAVEALEDALRYLPSLIDASRAAGADLREGRLDHGRPAIAGLAENLALLTALAHAAGLWAREAGLASTGWLGDGVDGVEQVVGLLQDAARRHDWTAAAAALEQDLPRALCAWHDRLAAGQAAVRELALEPTS